MALIMFEKKIAAGFAKGKRTTIRATAKPGVRIGAVVDLATWEGKAYRSKTKRFARAKIESIEPIEFTENECEIAGRRLSKPERLTLAKGDGFESWEEFAEFFKRKKTDERVFFVGVLIKFDKFLQTGEI